MRRLAALLWGRNWVPLGLLVGGGNAGGFVACVAGWLTGAWSAARLELVCRLPSPDGYGCGPFGAAS